MLFKITLYFLLGIFSFFAGFFLLSEVFDFFVTLHFGGLVMGEIAGWIALAIVSILFAVSIVQFLRNESKSSAEWIHAICIGVAVSAAFTPLYTLFVSVI